MKFRTEYLPSAGKFILKPTAPIVLAGSCFTENMGAKMREHSWEAVNPLGTLYNPLSIEMALDVITDEEDGVERFEESLFFFNGIWNSHLFDSSISAAEKKDCIEEFKLRKQIFQAAIEKGRTMIVTFGTSICYFLKENGAAVGNCHKQPSQLFTRRRFTIGEIVEIWERLLHKLTTLYEDLKVIFTVSPVRHIKDGFIENSRSKATLLLAIEQLCQGKENCDYFPAYEILNDDLRGYRFYARDLLHPSDEGIEYIWEKFVATYLNTQGKEYLTDGLKRFKAANHLPKTGALGKLLHGESPQ